MFEVVGKTTQLAGCTVEIYGCSLALNGETRLRTMGETRLWHSFFLPLAGLLTYLRWK